jgi:hypothetical protein
MAGEGIEMVRYADDFVLLCRSREEAERALERVREWTAPAGLTLHPIKTRIVDENPRPELEGHRGIRCWKVRALQHLHNVWRFSFV